MIKLTIQSNNCDIPIKISGIMENKEKKYSFKIEKRSISQYHIYFLDKNLKEWYFCKFSNYPKVFFCTEIYYLINWSVRYFNEISNFLDKQIPDEI